MSSFNVKVVMVDYVRQHPNADRLEVVKILGFDVVIGKNTFKNGDLAAYIPEASIVPDHIAEQIGVKGKLYGKKKIVLKLLHYVESIAKDCFILSKKSIMKHIRSLSRKMVYQPLKRFL